MSAIFLSRAPVHRISCASGERERLLRHKPDDRIVATAPLFREGADVQIDTRQSTKDTDTVRAV